MLVGRRIFVVEDEALIALLLEDLLDQLGCVVVEKAATLDEALRLAETIEADAAVLDVNVAGRQVYPLAEKLVERGIPIVFSTGYGAGGLPEAWRNRPVVTKPFDLPDLEAGLKAALGAG